jgi:hypothetical protein
MSGFNPNTITLIPSPNIANLKKIVCNAHEPVLLRLLVCKEEGGTRNADNCPYPEHKKETADKRACNASVDRLAQIYVRHEYINKRARSCVLVFIEGQYVSNTIALSQLLENTVNWLQIAQEKPYFYIFRYGQPVFGVDMNYAIKKLNSKIKEVFKVYAKDEDICIGVSVDRKEEFLQINQTSKFTFGAG